jgi:hypothetical protein
VNIGLESMWDEGVVAKFHSFSRHLPGGTNENYEKIAHIWLRFEPGHFPNMKQ